jgi:hypothetical protein
MLRITTTGEHTPDLIVRLCGQFTGEYVTEVEDTIRQAIPGQKIRLDLASVTFVDRPAMIFLCAANASRITVENVPSYVRRWIDQEKICSTPHPDVSADDSPAHNN